MKTYLTLYENERRTVGLLIRDQDDAVWEPPGSVYYSVVDSSGNTVVEETDSDIVDNGIYAFIDTNVTGTIGEYEIIWRIEGYNDDRFYHKTFLFVSDL